MKAQNIFFHQDMEHMLPLNREVSSIDLIHKDEEKQRYDMSGKDKDNIQDVSSQ